MLKILSNAFMAFRIKTKYVNNSYKVLKYLHPLTQLLDLPAAFLALFLVLSVQVDNQLEDKPILYSVWNILSNTTLNSANFL